MSNGHINSYIPKDMNVCKKEPIQLPERTAELAHTITKERSLERIEETTASDDSVLNSEWIPGFQYDDRPEKPHWTETVKPKEDHVFVNIYGRWFEFHEDLVTPPTVKKLFKRKMNKWKQAIKNRAVQYLTKLLLTSEQQCMQRCQTGLANLYTFTKKVLFFPFMVTQTKSASKNSTKNLRN